MDLGLDANVQPFIPSDDSDDEVAQAVATPPEHVQNSFASSLSSLSVASQTHNSPPRKRLRMHEEAEMEQRRREGPPQRDPEYYMSDGSCVLLVEHTLFNVHRTILSRDSSFFSSLFVVPTPSSLPQDGLSDDLPLVLHGDSASAFRNFLWVLYALPHEIAAGADLRRLIDIAHTANKYGFKKIEEWSLDSIVDVITRKSAPAAPTPSPSPFTFPGLLPAVPSPSVPASLISIASNSQIIELMRLAQFCAHERLTSSMVAALKHGMKSSVQNAYLALTLADELGLQTLQGEAYNEVLLRHFPARVTVLSDAHRADGLAAGDFEDAPPGAPPRLLITRAQQLRLLAGHYRLVSLWERLRRAPLPVEHSPSCELNYQKSSCAQSWLEFWREKSSSNAGVLGCPPVDVLGRLRALMREFDRLGTPVMMHPECRNSARRVVQEKVKEVTDQLPAMFAEDFD